MRYRSQVKQQVKQLLSNYQKTNQLSPRNSLTLSPIQRLPSQTTKRNRNNQQPKSFSKQKQLRIQLQTYNCVKFALECKNILGVKKNSQALNEIHKLKKICRLFRSERQLKMMRQFSSKRIPYF